MAVLKDGEVWFSDGKRFSPVMDVIGINAELELYSGYDASHFPSGDWGGEDDYTPEQLAELADFMIDHWKQFKAKHGTPTASTS